MKFLLERFRKILNSDNKRSAMVNRNVALSFLFKGINIFIQLALVPLTIHYLSTDQYGIWLTLSAILGWFSFFDIGLGNGLRNKLAEAIAEKNFEIAKKYVSTSYAILAVIFLSLPILFAAINPYLDWSNYLNAPAAMSYELSQLALVTFTFFCFRFVFGLISNILFAVQEAALNNLITTLGNIVSIFLIYLLRFMTPASLFWVGIIFSGVPVVVFVIVSMVLFYKKLSFIKPSLAHIDFKLARTLMGLGYKFLVIQIAGIVLFSATNIIIAQLFGPSEVTAYNIAFRYFTTLTMVYGIILTPLWSAFTEAYINNDLLWISNSVRRLNYISIAFTGICIVMVFLADPVYNFWIGNEVKVSKSISFTTGIFVIFSLFALPYNTFINGVGKIKLQYYSAIFSIIFTIPLAFFFTKYLGWGTAGIIVATLCTTIPCTIMWKIQFEKIINSKAKGIWNM